MKRISYRQSDCKACGERHSVMQFLNFGSIPLGNAFPRNSTDFAADKLYPLILGYCNKCFMVQQVQPPPVEALHKDYSDYSYVPVGPTLEKHYIALAQDMVKHVPLYSDSFVLDIGSNDGRLLHRLHELTSCRIQGVEPAEKISEMARQKGIPTLTAFYDEAAAAKVTDGWKRRADVIQVTQTLQHIPDLDGFFTNISLALNYANNMDATLLIEGRYFGDTLLNRTYDTIYHEMMWFPTLTSLSNLLLKHGFTIYHAERVPIYGGSLRVYARKSLTTAPSDYVPPPSVRNILEYEKTELIVKKDLAYTAFARDVERMGEALNKKVHDLRKEGARIAGYGAPSTSATLLSYSGLTYREISYIVDDSPLKQGKYSPGSHIPIVDSKMLDAVTPDYLLLLAWRLKDDIMPKLAKYRAKGMRVVVPLPSLEVI